MWANEAEALAKHENTEFIAVRGYKECADPIEVSVPMSLMAEQNAVSA